RLRAAALGTDSPSRRRLLPRPGAGRPPGRRCAAGRRGGADPLHRGGVRPGAGRRTPRPCPRAALPLTPPFHPTPAHRMPVQVGSPAPVFTLFDHTKTAWSLEAQRGHPVVLLFFPGAFTSVCTTELN